MSSMSDLFTEILFGSGVWFGLPILIGVFFLIAITVRYSSLFFVFILILLGFEYMSRITGTTLNVWWTLLCWGASAFLFAIFVTKDLKNK